MATGTRRSFRPSLGPHRLEDRALLSASSLVRPAVVQAPAVDPLVQPATLKTNKSSYLKTTTNEVHAAYQGFLNKYTVAVQKAIVALGNGQNEANLVNSLKAYTTLEGGVLEGQLQRISKRLPGGEEYLYNPPLGPVPGGYPTGGSSGPDIRYFVPPAQRLKTVADNLIATLTAVTTIQQASATDRVPLILKAYQTSRASVTQFFNFEVKKGIIIVVDAAPPTP
jgi:hypothetical protein